MLDRNCETTIIILMISNLHFIIHWPVYIHDITIIFYRIFWIIKYFFYTKARSTTSLPNSLPLSPATNHLWSAKHQPWLSVYMYIKTIGVYSRILQYVWRSKKSMYKRTKTSLIWLRPWQKVFVRKVHVWKLMRQHEYSPFYVTNQCEN